VICKGCSKKVAKCPQKCTKDRVEFVRCETVNMKLDELAEECKYCPKKIYGGNIKRHLPKCSKKQMPKSIKVSGLHKCTLKRI